MNRNIYLQVIFILLTGIVVPALAGLATYSADLSPHIIGVSIFFITIAFLLYEGGSRLHQRLRNHYTFNTSPFLKIISLCGASILFSTVTAGTMILLWISFLHGHTDWRSVYLYILLLPAPVIICTLVDEIVLLSREKMSHTLLDFPPRQPEQYHPEELLTKLSEPVQEFTGFLPVTEPSGDPLTQTVAARKKNRLVVRKGLENIAIRLDDIVLIYTENKIVYVLDHQGRKFLIDKTLTDLQEELTEELFFRANRQYIINIDYVRGFKTYEKVKLQVYLTVPDIDHSIIISQEVAPAFRKWMSES